MLDLKKDFYKTGEVANLLGLHPRTIQSYCDKGFLQHIRTASGIRLIPVHEVMRLLHSRSESRDLIYGDSKELLIWALYQDPKGTHIITNEEDLEKEIQESLVGRIFTDKEITIELPPYVTIYKKEEKEDK